jgi:hypothetical protein
MEEIDERIRLKAGNVISKRPTMVESQQVTGALSSRTEVLKPQTVAGAGKQEVKMQSSEVIPRPEQKKEDTEKKPDFGIGISADQIDKIVRDFRK